MHRLVLNCFKAIIYSMLFIFILNFAFYLYKVTELNHRVESIVSSMQRVVMENNYMPPEMNDVYASMFAELYNSYNGFDGSTTGVRRDDLNMYMTSNGTDVMEGSMSGSVMDLFIVGIGWNYSHPAQGNFQEIEVRNTNGAIGSMRNILRKQMNKPANFGDVMLVQVIVQVQQPMFSMSGNRSSDDFKLDKWARTNLVYNYYVPCLKYQQID